MDRSSGVSSWKLDPVVMRGLVWSGVALVAMTVIGFAWLMHYVPPPRADWTPEQIFEFVKTNKTSILVGAALCCFFWSFWATWVGPLIIFIRRMESAPVLTFVSLANVGGGAAIITSIAVTWTVMAFRVEDPIVVQAFNDYGFFLFFYTWPPFAIFMFIIAIAIFRDVGAQQTFPRWVAFYNLWCGVLMAPASLMGLFKTGPFAYHGILSFWLVAIDFFVWMLVMSFVMLAAIAREEKRTHARVGAPAMQST